MSFEGIWWHIGEYCVNLIVLKIVLKKKKDSLVFLEHGTGIKLGYSGILWNPVALLLWLKLLGLCWSLLNSNQAFEYWFLLHFNPYRGRIHRNLYSEMLGKLLGMEYRKKEGFASDLYNYLLSRQPQARRNAEVILSEIYAGTPAAEESSTTDHLLVSELNKYL